jgi:hypothetical protein
VATSRNGLDGKIVNIRRGLAIYKVGASPYWRVRIWIPSERKRVVKTTKVTTRIEAISIAEEYMSSLGTRGYLAAVPTEKSFEHFADKLVLVDKARGESGEISKRQWSHSKNMLNNPKWGAVGYFRGKDVSAIQTKDYNAYMAWVRQQAPTLSAGTLNHITVVFRRLMKLARDEGAIVAVPQSSRVKRKDNPRSFFRFFPLVSKDEDEYEKIKREAKTMALENVKVRGITVTEELYDFILFMTQSFLRPTESEVYALTHREITLAENPHRLLISIRKGKTGQRVSNTMPGAVSAYNRLKKRNEGAKPNDHIFLPACKNRGHAKRIIQRQFNALLERCGLKVDPYTNTVRTVYSLRHTAICMRLILSEGRSTSSILPKMLGRASIRSSASMLEICPSAQGWRGIFRALEASERILCCIPQKPPATAEAA